jgi:hypothetical protein
VTREKGHATVLFSREELLLLEFCLLYVLHHDTQDIEHAVLDEDTAKDAAELLRELRLYLGEDQQAIGERLLEKLKASTDE